MYVYHLFLSCSPPVGNKNDDPARKHVETQDAVRFGESVGVRVFETSAKENINVEEVTTLPVAFNLCFCVLDSLLIISGGIFYFKY